MKDIILIALEQEAPHMAEWDNVFFTGVGKVNAAIMTARLIERYTPHTVYNFGTAGGVRVSSGIHEMQNFVQRDMMCCELGSAPGQTPFEENIELTFGDGLLCSTGDNFVTDPSTLAYMPDVVDMEAYAIAKACIFAGVEFKCYKYVSDQADENASKDWQDTVADGEKHYIEIYQQITGGF